MPSHKAMFSNDADVEVPLDRLCNVLLTKWVHPATQRHNDASDKSFLRYTFNSSMFRNPDPFYGVQHKGIPLPDYAARLLRFLATAPFPCVVMALRLIDKYHHFTMGTIARSNVHLIFAAAMVVVSKAHCDENMSWEYYCRVIGVPSALLSNLEIIMLFECRWDILPSFDEYATYRALLVPAPKIWGFWQPPKEVGVAECDQSSMSASGGVSDGDGVAAPSVAVPQQQWWMRQQDGCDVPSQPQNET